MEITLALTQALRQVGARDEAGHRQNVVHSKRLSTRLAWDPLLAPALPLFTRRGYEMPIGLCNAGNIHNWHLDWLSPPSPRSCWRENFRAESQALASGATYLIVLQVALTPLAFPMECIRVWNRRERLFLTSHHSSSSP
jgi:hypothetical protein